LKVAVGYKKRENQRAVKVDNLSWRPFLESPETFRVHFGCHNSPCIFETKASRGPNLGSYFNFYSLNKTGKEQLYRISGFEFYEWLFGPKKFSGLSRNGPLHLTNDYLNGKHLLALCSSYQGPLKFKWGSIPSTLHLCSTALSDFL